MAYKDYIVRDLPSAAWALDENGFLQDYSGNGLHSLTGKSITSVVIDEDENEITSEDPVSPRTSSQIIANASRSVLANNEDTNYFPVPPLFMTERGDFTIETWFRPISVPEATTVLGHEGASDGITFDGESIKFKVNFLNFGSAECIHFPPVEDKTFHVVGQRSANRVRLFVDGLIVSEVVLSEAQNFDYYATVSNPTRLASGYSTLGNGKISVDGVAVYERSISDINIATHYFYGRNTPDSKSVIEYFSGAYWNMTDAQADIARSFEFSPWNEGVSNNVNVVSGTLYPEIDSDGLTFGGNWTYGTFLGSEPVAGSKIEWDSDGAVTVQTSIDGEVSWTNCINGNQIPGVDENFDSQDKTFSVRVLFLQGEPEEDTISKVRNLKVVLYRNRSLSNSQGDQFVTFEGDMALATKEYNPIDRNARMGAQLTDASLLVAPVNLDTTLDTCHGVSFWFKFSGENNDGKFLADLRRHAEDDAPRMYVENGSWFATSFDLYIDGAVTISGIDNLDAGSWYYIALGFREPTSDAFRLASAFDGTGRLPCRISNLSVYRQPLDPQEVAMIYRSYLGLDTATFGEQETLAVTDSLTPPQFYAFNWTYMGV